MSNELKHIVEAVLMVSDTPLSVVRIQAAFADSSVPDTDTIKAAIAELQQDCQERAVELKKIGNGYRFQTKIKYAEWIRKLQAGRPPKLSRALLETLAIIAYRQPVSRGDIEDVRGVSVSAEIMQRLLEREWIKQVGVRDTPGRPAIFGTTPAFLAYFNLESLSGLPALMEQRELGVIAGEFDAPLPPEILAALDTTKETEKQQDVFKLNAAVSRPEQPDQDSAATTDAKVIPLVERKNERTEVMATAIDIVEPDAKV